MSLAAQDAEGSERVAPFTMIGTPLLEEGRYIDLIAAASQLWIHAKVYAEGGERGLHSHPEEDHAFFVLQGRATFTTSEGEHLSVGPFEGIMIPRGVLYAFESDGDESLVVLRIGAGAPKGYVAGRPVAMQSRGADGHPAARPPKGTPVPGRVFTGQPE